MTDDRVSVQPGCGERAVGRRGTGQPNLSLAEPKFLGANGDRGKK